MTQRSKVHLNPAVPPENSQPVFLPDPCSYFNSFSRAGSAPSPESLVPSDSNFLLTTPQTARILKFKERTLEDWRRRGVGPPFVRISPRTVRYRWGDVLDWIEQRIRTNTINSIK